MNRARRAATVAAVIGFVVVIVGIFLIATAKPDPEAIWADRSAALSNSVLSDPDYQAGANAEQARDKAAQDKMIGVIVAVTGGLVLLGSVVTLIALPRRENDPAETV